MNHLGNPWAYHFYGSVLIDEDLEIDGVIYGNHIEAESIQAKTDDISISSRNNNASLLVSDTGYVSINNEYDLPIADGTADQFLRTDGLGNTSFATITPSIISDFKLSELTDTDIIDPLPDNYLTYDGLNWRNKTFPINVDETGNIDMNNQNISNVNLVDGVDVWELDTNAVKITGNQTIAGDKKFTSTLEISGSSLPSLFDGIGLSFDNKIGVIQAIKIATNTLYPIEIIGSYVELYAGNTLILKATGTTLDLNNNKITSLANPSGPNDGANKTYVDTNFVDKTSPQTIGGAKTFSNQITANAGINMSSQNITNIGQLNGTAITAFITTNNFNTTFDTRIGQTSIDALSDVVITTAVNGQLLIHNGTNWVNVASPFLKYDGSVAMTGALNMGNQNITSAGTISGTTISSSAGMTTTTLATTDKITMAQDKPLIIGRTTKGTGATGGFELYGTGVNISGPHIQVFTTADSTYPIFQQLNWAHDNISLNFDCYYDGTNFKSSASGSNFSIYKASSKLSFYYKSGVAAGSNITWSEAMNISNAGAITANAGVSTTTLTTSDNIVVGAGKSVFIDRNAFANNKLVLWDGNTGSNLNFLGFGVASATLMYNVNASTDSHVFYYGATNELLRVNNTAIINRN